MLKLEVYEHEVFCHYTPPNAGPNNGGYLCRVGVDGHFYGFDYQKLSQLGTGSHDIVLDEHAGYDCGKKKLEVNNEIALYNFMYECGVITEHERQLRVLEFLKIQIIAELGGLSNQRTKGKLNVSNRCSTANDKRQTPHGSHIQLRSYGLHSPLPKIGKG